MISITIYYSTFLLDLINGQPDLSGFQEPTKSILHAAFNAGNYEVLPEPEPVDVVIPEPNWQALYDRLLGGNLFPIFESVTIAAMKSTNNAFVVARGDIFGAIVTTRNEQALASALGMLAVAGYTFSDEHKDLWNKAISELNFSDLVKL